MEIASKALKSSGAASAGAGDSGTAGVHSSLSRVAVTTSSPRQQSDTSSVISFINPMSTSTPKNLQQATSQLITSKDSSQTSPSMSYPVMSLIRTVSPRAEPSKGQSSSVHLDSSDKTISGYRSVEFKSEPAVLPISSSTQTSKHKSSSSSAKSEKSDKSADGSSQKSSKIDKSSKSTTSSSSHKSSSGSKSEKDEKSSTNISSQKSAARAAFFSSLSSPTTPTTTTTVSPLSLSSVPTTESPTELKSKSSSGRAVSPLRGIPGLVRSGAVSMPKSSVATSISKSQIPSMMTVSKPSSLAVSGGSGALVSSQEFSPVSPSSATTSGSMRSKMTFTAIPKPYSPTKTIPSPITPESPKYRIHSSIITDSSGKKSVSTQARDTSLDSGRQRVIVIPSRDSSGYRHGAQSKDSSSKPGTQSKDSGAKPKKVPPPPPPRKSSRLPGHAVLAVNAATLNGTLTASKSETQTDTNVPSAETQVIRETIIDPPEEFANSTSGSTKIVKSDQNFIDPPLKQTKQLNADKSSPVHIKTSVDKSVERSDLSADKRADVETAEIKSGQSTETKSSFSEKSENSKLDKAVKSEQAGEINGTNGFGSSGSSSSLDSQLEIVWLKREDTDCSIVSASESKTSVVVATTAVTSTMTSSMTSSVTSQASSSSSGSPASSENASPKKPKPAPPERRSSLSSKSKTDSYDSGDESSKTKKMMKRSSDSSDTKSSSSDTKSSSVESGKQEGSPVKKAESKSKTSKSESKDIERKV